MPADEMPADGQRHEYEYTVVLEPTDPGGFSVYVPALPGVVTCGDTLEEALAMAREAIGFHLEGLRARGEEIPVEVRPRRSRSVRVPLRVAA